MSGPTWFPSCPTASRANVVRPVPAAPRPAVASVSSFLKSGELPPKFLQVTAWETETLAPGASSVQVIRFDDDLPFRLDGIQASASGVLDAAAWVTISVELPSGRKLTRSPLILATLCGQQGGKSFVYFRHRFPRSGSLVLTVSNLHPSASLSVRGEVVGYKLTGAPRL